MIYDNSLSCDILWMRFCYWKKKISLQETHGPGPNVSSSGVCFLLRHDAVQLWRESPTIVSAEPTTVFIFWENSPTLYREDAAAGCIICCWIATSLPLFYGTWSVVGSQHPSPYFMVHDLLLDRNTPPLILRYMICCWIATPLPLFTRFDSQSLLALPIIKLHLEGTKISGHRQRSARKWRQRWGLFRKSGNIAGLRVQLLKASTWKETLSLSSDKIIAIT